MFQESLQLFTSLLHQFPSQFRKNYNPPYWKRHSNHFACTPLTYSQFSWHSIARGFLDEPIKAMHERPQPHLNPLYES